MCFFFPNAFFLHSSSSSSSSSSGSSSSSSSSNSSSSSSSRPCDPGGRMYVKSLMIVVIPPLPLRASTQYLWAELPSPLVGESCEAGDKPHVVMSVKALTEGTRK